MSTEESPLEKAHRVMAEKRAAGEVTRKDPIQKAQEHPTSLRKAITAKCWDCVGAGADPNPRAEIRHCPCTECPLHPVRPYQKKSGTSELGENQENEDEQAVPSTHALL